MNRSWLLQHIRARIQRVRGGHALRHLLGSLEDMDHATLRDLWTLMENLETDSRSDGARRGARQPWRHF